MTGSTAGAMAAATSRVRRLKFREIGMDKIIKPAVYYLWLPAIFAFLRHCITMGPIAPELTVWRGGMKRYKKWVMTGALVVAGALWNATAAAQDDWDACKMLRQADVETAFAPRKFDTGTLGKNVVKSSPKLAAVSRCTYTSAGVTPKDRITVSLLARRAPSDTTGVTPEAAKAGALQLKAVPVDVAGMGNGAYTVNMGSSAFPVIELNVFRGKRDWLVFGCGAAKLDQNGAIAGLKKVAQATVNRQ